IVCLYFKATTTTDIYTLSLHDALPIYNKYTIKNRGFNISEKNSSFYLKFNLNKEITIKNNNFVTFFKATTKKFTPEELGHIKEDEYNINPINLGGKRLIKDEELQRTNLNTSYIRTNPKLREKYIEI